MNIFIIHGDDTEKSHERLHKFIEEAKRRSWEVVFLDESPLSLKENISSGSLFGNTRFFIHRDFKNIVKNDLKYLAENITNFDGNLILFSDTSIAGTVLKSLPKGTKVEEYKLPVIIWKFLDTIYPGNTKMVLTTMHKILATEAPEKILGLLAWHLRDLYRAIINPESFTNQTWRLNKLKSQAEKFKEGSLGELISDLADIDIKSKTTQSNLSEMLDLSFIRILK